jgi:glycosyltransferase involved in cell wall biosynthesis
MINIVVPSYNEARNVAHVIENIAAVFGAIEPKRVIVVDDGSDDDTEAVVAPLLARYPFLEYVKHPRNMGLGAALRTGYLRCQGGMAGWLPADGQFDAKWILAFRDAWQRTGAPIVVGNITAGDRLTSDGLFRLTLSKFLRVLRFLRKQRGINFNGLMLFDVTQVPVASFKATTGLINFEILEWFERRGARVAYQEITVQPRLSGKSKVTNLKSYFAVLRDMLFR